MFPTYQVNQSSWQTHKSLRTNTTPEKLTDRTSSTSDETASNIDHQGDDGDQQEKRNKTLTKAKPTENINQNNQILWEE